MLHVQDIVAMPGVGLDVAAGAGGLDHEIRWLHVSELADPTPWLGGGELLLTIGIGIGDRAAAQRTYVRRLAEHGLAGLGLGVGFGFDEVPGALAEEADKHDFPILRVPYEVPFIAISKAVFAHLASEQLDLVTQALEVHERLAQAIVHGRGLQALLAVLCNHLGCSLALVGESGRVLAERHARRRLPFDGALELPVVADDELATLKAVREHGEFGEYDLLVLHHGQTALAFELSKRHAVSAAELRLAGDLLDDLEHERLGDRDAARRMAAFGLEPARDYAALIAVPLDGLTSEGLRLTVARELDRRAVRYLSTARRDKAAFLVEAPTEDAVLALARRIVTVEAGARFSVGRPAQGRALGRSLLGAPAARPLQRRPAGAGPRARAQPARGARRARRRDHPGRLLPRPRLARAAAQPPGRGTRGVRRPRPRRDRRERVAPGVADRAARVGLPMERRGAAARRPPAHAPLPDGASPRADRASPGRPRAADGALARGQGKPGAGGETEHGLIRAGVRRR